VKFHVSMQLPGCIFHLAWLFSITQVRAIDELVHHRHGAIPMLQQIGLDSWGDLGAEGSTAASVTRVHSHPKEVPLTAFLEMPRTPLFSLMSTSLDKWGVKAGNCSKGPLLLQKSETRARAHGLQGAPFSAIGPWMENVRQNMRLMSFGVPVVCWLLWCALIACCVYSPKSDRPWEFPPEPPKLQPEQLPQMTTCPLSEDYSWTTQVSSVGTDVSSAGQNAEHFDIYTSSGMATPVTTSPTGSTIESVEYYDISDGESENASNCSVKALDEDELTLSCRTSIDTQAPTDHSSSLPTPFSTFSEPFMGSDTSSIAEELSAACNTSPAPTIDPLPTTHQEPAALEPIAIVEDTHTNNCKEKDNDVATTTLSLDSVWFNLSTLDLWMLVMRRSTRSSSD